MTKADHGIPCDPCLVTVNLLWLLLAVPCVGLHCVILLFPDDTHVLLEGMTNKIRQWLLTAGCQQQFSGYGQPAVTSDFTIASRLSPAKSLLTASKIVVETLGRNMCSTGTAVT